MAKIKILKLRNISIEVEAIVLYEKEVEVEVEVGLSNKINSVVKFAQEMIKINQKNVLVYVLCLHFRGKSIYEKI
jgi:hypothetical protein